MIWTNKVHTNQITMETINTFLDHTWLKILNKERKKENLGQISNSLFEAVIDSLEKEWFNLVTKSIKQKVVWCTDS